jgi:hypothetical protein
MKRPKTLTLIGLILTVLGAAWTAKAVIIDDQTATALAGMYWEMNPVLKKALLDQSSAARDGLILIVLGSVFQVFGVLLAD